jgi:hypothetical protein
MTRWRWIVVGIFVMTMMLVLPLLAGPIVGPINQVACSAGSFINAIDVTSTCATAAGGVTGLANPTASIGTAAVNGVATTAMRSDAAPAIPQASASTFGAMKPDGTTQTAAAGVISTAATTINGQTCTPGGSCSVAGGSTGFANPTATIGTAAVNGVATTAMRSDGAPAIPQASASTFGAMKPDGTTQTAAAGVISTAATTIDGTSCTPGGSCSTPATQRLAIGWDAGLDPGASGSENIIVTLDQNSTVQDIRGTVSHVVGSAATLSINKAASGTACSAGTTLHSGSFDGNGTAATNQSLTVTTSALTAGDRLCVVTTNGANWIAGAGVGGITVRITTP